MGQFWNLYSAILQKLSFSTAYENDIRLISRCRVRKLCYLKLWAITDITPLSETVSEALLMAAAVRRKNLLSAWTDTENVRKQHKNLSQCELFQIPCCEFAKEKTFPAVSVITMNEETMSLATLTELILKECNEPSAALVIKIFKDSPLKKLCIINSLFPYNNCNNIELRERFKAISRCQTLEEISVDLHYYRMFERELLKLRNLHRLHLALPLSLKFCACESRPISRETAILLGKATKMLTIHGELTSNWNVLKSLIQNMTNVECLNILYANCNSSHIINFIETMENLKQFYFRGTLDLDSNDLTENYLPTPIEEHLLYVLEYCKDIEVFDFSETNCDASFLEKAVGMVRHIFLDRKTALNLGFHQTRIKKADLEKLEIPDCIKILDIEVDFGNVPAGIQCYF